MNYVCYLIGQVINSLRIYDIGNLGLPSILHFMFNVLIKIGI